MLLADSAQVAAGKLYILGGGWTVMGPAPTAMSLALRFEVSWDEAGRDHDWQVALVDADGRPVTCVEHGTHPVVRGGRFQTQRAPDADPGTPISFVIAVDAGVVTVAPGGRYVWILSVDGQTRDDWQLAFNSRPVGPAARP